MTSPNAASGNAPQTVCGHFGIRYSPFTDTFPIGEPFATEGETLLLERMQMLLGQGKCLSVTGEPGSGKSMLLKTLLSGLEQKAFRFAYVPYSGLKPNTLLREICDKLAIDTTGRGSLLGRLHKALCRYRHKALYAEFGIMPRRSLQPFQVAYHRRSVSA